MSTGDAQATSSVPGTGDVQTPGAPPIHVDTSNDPVIVSQGDRALAPGSAIAPEHFVDKSSDPHIVPTAGELREKGYEVDPELADDAPVGKFSADAHEPGQEAPQEPGTGDEPGAAGTLIEADPHAYEPPPDPGAPAVDPDPDVATGEFQAGAAAADAGEERQNPYDRRTRQGKDWDAGYDSVSA